MNIYITGIIQHLNPNEKHHPNVLLVVAVFKGVTGRERGVPLRRQRWEVSGQPHLFNQQPSSA